MTPKKYCLLFSFLLLTGTALVVNLVGLDTLKDYAIPNKEVNQTEIKPETTNKGTTERLAFQNINNRVFLLEPFRSTQSKDLYILTEAEEYKGSEISNMSCVLCKGKNSFYDDPNECQILKLEAVHRTHFKVDPLFRTATFFQCKIPNQVEANNYTMSTLKIGEDYGHLVRITDIDKNQGEKEKNNIFITMCAGPQYGKTKKAVNLAE
jgi:hypothetical protein